MRFASANDFYCHVLSHVRNTDRTDTDKNLFVCSWDGKDLIYCKHFSPNKGYRVK